MKKIEAAILLPDEEYLLILANWLEENSRDDLISELVDRCIQEKVRKACPEVSIAKIEDIARERSHELIWDAVPFCHIGHSFGDWWGDVLARISQVVGSFCVCCA